MNPTVFLGLVTHRGSRYPNSQGPDGLVRALARELAQRGVTCDVAVHVDDLHTEALLPLTNAQVRASIDAELTIEQRWRTYLNPAAAGAALRVTMAARRAYRRVRLAPPWHRGPEATAGGSAMLRRLVNIEIAHLALMRQALASEAAWALVVEDDAQLKDAEVFASALAGFVRDASAQEQPGYVNLSRSFDHSELGTEERFTPVGEWSPGVRTLASDRAVTNTVCAILYRGSFLRRLFATLEGIPVAPVLPIDWKLNAALLAMDAAGELRAGDCWFLDPAPIVQGSMHDHAD